MKITVVGAGYVGLVTAACFAEMGHTVTCVDRDAAKIEALTAGRVPFHEPGLEPLVQSNAREGRLRFAAQIAEAADAEIYFIGVGTPPAPDGSVDLSQVEGVAREIGRSMRRDCIVVGKSTVPIGTTEVIGQRIGQELKVRGAGIKFDLVSNPEFLKEGDAVSDFMRPDRVIVGASSQHAIDVMRRLYAPFTRNHERMLVMSTRDAEMTKYAANAMLATRISFMNEMANICERLGVDVENVRLGIGSDPRIGRAFLYAGIGYGGSCLPKDVQGLMAVAQANGVNPELLRAVDSRNVAQKLSLFEKIRDRFEGRLTDRLIAVWGLAFKPGTDDLRDAPAMVLIERLLEAGARVRAYDPVAMGHARRTFPGEWFGSGLEFVEHQYDALKDADALALVTEWKPFRNPDFDAMKKIMKQHIIFDGRNQYDPQSVRERGFEYFGIGR